MIGLEADSPLWDSLLAGLPEGSIDRASLEAGESCILLVPRYLPEGEGARTRVVDEDSFAALREDEKAGYLLELGYDPIFAASAREDRAIRPGDRVKLSAFSQSLSGERLAEKRVDREIRVQAVISVLTEPFWPLSHNCASHVLISGDALVRTLYPSASTRMTGSQARSHRFMAKIFYPDCYGLTRIAVRNLPHADAIRQDTAASNLSEEYGLDFLNYRMQKDREQASAQRRALLFLLLGIEMALILATLIYSAAGMAVEQDRYRYGTLQALGVSESQIFRGELVKSFGVAVAACAAANLVMAALLALVALLSGRFLQTLLQNLDSYPWLAYALICAAFVGIYSLLQSLPVRRISRQQPIQNIRS